jgi:putative ABC transport system permease protein
MAVKEWLEGFPYRATLNWFGFMVAGILVILFAAITISLQAFKKANANPIKSLRSE